MLKQLLILSLSIPIVLIVLLSAVFYTPELGTRSNNSITIYLPILLALILPFILPSKNKNPTVKLDLTRMDYV